MINTLSILIPTYNHICTELVESLQAQASSLPNLEYEILVADDGSTDEYTIEENRIINQLGNCRYIERETNVGRAAIRNFLAQQAKHPWLLFIDSDLHTNNPYFIQKYIQAEGEVIVGGLKIGGNPTTLKNNLRYKYEKSCEKQHDFLHRKKIGNKEFRTTNFLIAKDIISQCPFDESFKYYGYEDVLFGKSICQNGYSIVHIDNPILLDDYETNYHFVLKTEEACRTLYQFRKELKGYSKLIDYSEFISKMGIITPILKRLFPWIGLHIKARLTGNKPSILWFNIYKFLYYIHLEA